MKILSLTLVILSLGALGACNTVEGFGKDLKSGGQAIEKTAKDIQN